MRNAFRNSNQSKITRIITASISDIDLLWMNFEHELNWNIIIRTIIEQNPPGLFGRQCIYTDELLSLIKSHSPVGEIIDI